MMIKCNWYFILTTFVFTTFYNLVSSSDLPAQWMSGKFGMGFRIMAGDFIERHETNGHDWGLDWSLLVNQFEEVGATHVIVNLSEGAYGSTWMAYHPVLFDINTKPDTTCVPWVGGNGWDGNCQTAPTPSSNFDYFKDLLDNFHMKNIKVIVYVASQGPAMFKHGSNNAFDVFRRKSPIRDNCIEVPKNVGPAACFSDPDNCCSPSIGNWIKYVKNEYSETNTIDYPILHKAFADVIIGYYASTYKNDIDGWWFDHASEKASCDAGSTCTKDFIDKTAVRDAIRKHQPNVPIAFNSCSDAQKSPLQLCSPNLEDFTAGHPKPMAGSKATLPYQEGNYPMVTSVEGTPNGFFDDDGWKSLGHVFMPTGTKWNGVTIPVVWTTPYPYDPLPYQNDDFEWSSKVTTLNSWNTNATSWFDRVIAAGGSWTWNLPRQSNSPGTYFLLHPNHLELVKIATASQPPPPPVLDEWAIQEPQVSISNTVLNFQQWLGPSDKSEESVTLYTENCKILLTSVDPVSVANEKKVDETTAFDYLYDVVIDTTKINSTSSIVTYTNDTNVVSEIRFCINLDRLLGAPGSDSIVVSNMQTNILLNIQSAIDFTYTFNISHSEVIGTVEQELPVNLEVENCQCSSEGFDCLNTPTSLKMLETLYICFKPKSEEVILSNFDLNIRNTQNGFNFDAVQFGDGGPNPESNFVAITTSPDSRTTKVSTLMFYEFFDSDNTEISVSGTSYLVFDTARNEKANAFESFKISFNLDNQSAENVDSDTTIFSCIYSMLSSIFE